MIRISAESPEFLKEALALGIALSTEPNLDLLLDRILSLARSVTGAEAGTIFVVDGDSLRFAAVQNDFLARRFGEGEMRERLQSELVPLNIPSLCGHVATTGNLVNIMDAYAVNDDHGLGFYRKVDQKTGYVTCSVFAVPLETHTNRIVGVLELLNRLNDDQVIIAFDAAQEPLIRWCAAQAAVAIGVRSPVV